MRSLTCNQSDELRRGLVPVSSITNYVCGEVLNPGLPPITATTWGRPDGTEVLRDERDENGCLHYDMEESAP